MQFENEIYNLHYIFNKTLILHQRADLSKEAFKILVYVNNHDTYQMINKSQNDAAKLRTMF